MSLERNSEIYRLRSTGMTQRAIAAALGTNSGTVCLVLNGGPNAMVRPATTERFWAKVNKTETCWLWMATTNPKGYGRFRDGKAVSAHRWAYEQVAGPIPEGLQLDHLCRVRNCVNPAHLEPVTGAVNQKRGLVNQNFTKTACGICGGDYDHFFTGRTGNTWRNCRSCVNRSRREQSARERLSRLAASAT